MTEPFYSKLDSDKLKISRNKNPIEMDIFLSFLEVDVVWISEHLGSYTGWTLRENENIKLRIGGGIVSNVEYLDTIQYGTRLSNIYNNYVNPFYLFDILTKEGQKFFIEYYKSDIENILKYSKNDIDILARKLESAKKDFKILESEIKSIAL